VGHWRRCRLPLNGAVHLLQVLAQLVLPLELFAALGAAELPRLGVAHHVQLQLHLATKAFLAQLTGVPALFFSFLLPGS
jgi:hypothetical protein